MAHAQNLATTLTEEDHDYISAAQIYAEHLSDIPTAARLFCRGSRFGDATRLLALHGKQALIPEIVDTGLAEAMSSTTEFLADCRAQILAQVPRIGELRVRRATDPLAFFGGDPLISELDGNVPDNVSLAPTDATTAAGRSMFTRYTSSSGISQQTSKNRRREERRRARGKKGTIYEEEYLVSSVRRLTERVNSTVDEVQVLVDALLRRGMREHATSVEKGLQELLIMCRAGVREVFEIQHETEKVGDYVGEDRAGREAIRVKDEAAQPRGAKAVLRESLLVRDAPGQEVPVVRDFKKPALLD
jgi:elongator complex protein 1